MNRKIDRDFFNDMNRMVDSFDDKPSLASNILKACSSLLLLPLGILNFLSLPVGSVWLCVLGYWKPFIFGLLLWAVGWKLVGILTIPSSLLAVTAARTVELRSRFRWLYVVFLLFGSFYYGAFVFAAWSLLCLNWFVESVHTNATIPALLVAYAVALSPVVGMSDPKSRKIQETLTALCVAAELIAMGVLVLFHVRSLRLLAAACVAVIMVFVPFQVWIALKALASAEQDDCTDASAFDSD